MSLANTPLREITEESIHKACNQYPQNEREYNFSEEFDGLLSAFKMLSTAYEVAIQLGVDPNLRRVVDIAANPFISLYGAVRDYSRTSERDGGRTRHDEIKGFLQSFIRTLYTGGPIEGWNPPIYNSVLNAYILAKAPGNVDGALTDALEKIGNARSDVASLVEEAKRTLAPQAIANYADQFSKSAKEHSRKNIDTPRPEKGEPGSIKWHFGFLSGAAQRFMLVAALLIALGALFVAVTHTDKLLPLNQESLSSLVERLLGVILLAYVIRLCFKQYSIHKHLYTLDIQRANTLDSFKLLYSTVGKESPAVREELILLVAATVYSAGLTGYLDDKTVDEAILPTHQLLDKIIDRAKPKP